MEVNETEGIDFDKLRIVVRKNLLWILLIFFTANISAYLYIRWTKDVYESESEMKLDIKQDATELGIQTLVEDQNLNIISGEIEQIKSKIFLNRVIDSLDLAISYYSIGKVLVDEKFRYSPIAVEIIAISEDQKDHPVSISFTSANSFTARFDESDLQVNGNFEEAIDIQGLKCIISKTRSFDPNAEDDYYFTVNSRKALLEYLSENISVEPLNFNANTIKISFKDHNALKAYTIVNKIDSLYIKYSNEQKNLANKQKIDWLNNELLQVEDKMENYENYFENFTLKNKSVNVDDDLKKTIFYISKIDSQRFELNKRLTELNLLIESLASNNPELAINQKSFLPEYLNEDIDVLQKMIQERNKLALAYNENTFAFRQKENELSALKDQVFSQLANLKKGWLQNIAEMNRNKERLEKEFASMPDKNTQFTKNQRFYKLYEEFYLSMMQSKAQFEIAQAGNTPDFKILSPATLPTAPIAPQKLMILGIGLVASFVFIFFFVGIAYLLNNKIIGIGELEHALDIPILGSVPATSSIPKSELMVLENPKSRVSEAIRSIRTSIDFFATDGNKKVISISSTVSAEGKSFLATNLSGVLAMSKKKVILLDLDMRKAKVNTPFSVKDSSKGMSTILIKKHDWKDCVTETELENFSFIPAGPHPPNPSELLLNGAFEGLLKSLKEEFDYVVMDTPPVGLVTDGIMVMKKSDLSIYVFRANYSKKEFISNLKRTIKINKLQNVTAILNALPSNEKSYGYGYYEDKEKTSPIKKFLRI